MRYRLDSYDIPDNFTPTTDYVAEQEGLDPDLFNAMLTQEGAFNRRASSLSPAGAIGPGQLMPGTADELGVDPYDPVQNLFGSARYLGDRLDRWDGDVPKALAGYNAGDGAVAKYGGVPPYKETQNYVKNITGSLGDPIPDLPDLGNASKYNKVELDTATIPGISRRERDLSRIAAETTALETTKNEALKGLGSQGHLEGGDAIAIALTALLPTLLGFGLRGKAGAAMGAQAGAQGANVGLSALTNQMARKDQNNQLIYADAKQQLAGKQAEQRAVESKIADDEFMTGRDERLYGAGGLKPSANSQFAKQRPPLDDRTIALIAKQTGQSEEDVRALSSSDNERVKTLLYALGGNVKPVSDSTLSQLSSGQAARQNIDSLRPLVSKMSQDSNLERAIKSGNASSYYKEPGSAAYDFYAQLPILQKQVAGIMESGKLTDQDVAFLAPFITGSIMYDTPDTINSRLDKLQGFLEQRSNSIVDLQGRGGRNISALRDFSTPTNTPPSSNSSEERIKYVDGKPVPYIKTAQGWIPK